MSGQRPGRRRGVPDPCPVRILPRPLPAAAVLAAAVPAAVAALLAAVPLRAAPAGHGSATDAAARAVDSAVPPSQRSPFRKEARVAPPAASASDTVVDPAYLDGLRFRWVGPSRGGRVTAVAGHSELAGTYFMGSTGGGVWKTGDGGRTWENLSDGAFATPSIGALAVAPSRPGVLYAGTGSDGLRSNVITGRGVYRSTDGGESWTFLGLREAGQVGAVEVDPRNPDRVWVAALGHPFGANEQRGVFRSTDGGTTWTRLLFVSDSVGAVDLELAPGEPDVLYAAMWRGERKPWTIVSGCRPGCGDGVYRSDDGGETWKRLAGGLPSGPVGKVDLAVTPAAPGRVYALVEAPGRREGLYRSDDRGESWRQVSHRQGLMHRPFYFTNVHAHPTDPDVVFVGNVALYRSRDGGRSFERLETPHVDHHALWIDPARPDAMILGTDGGATVSSDAGATWSSLFNQPTAELYQVDVDDRSPYWLYAGQQDWSTVAVPSLPPAGGDAAGPGAVWEEVGGCETGPAVPRPPDARVVYANCKGRFGRYSRRTGQEQNYWVGGQFLYGRNPARLTYRFQRTAPVEISPHDPGVVYHASQYVHRTGDGGRTWERISPDLTANPPERQVRSGGPITHDITGEEHFSALYVVEESPVAPGVIWAGSNDGLVHVTRDGGGSWSDVTPPALPPEARINAVHPSPHDPATAYLAAYRFLLDDWRPYAFRTRDYGATWRLLTDGDDGIPADVPVRVVRQDRVRRDLLYAGTEFGLYLSFDGGDRWQRLRRGLPTTPVTDLEVHRGDLVLSTMGRGFWILDDLSRLRQLQAALEERGGPRPLRAPHLFAPRPAHRLRYDPSPGRRRRGRRPPEYPPPGAILDYHVPASAGGAVRLEIADGRGRPIRTFSGGASEGDLEGSPGTHRFVWDLRHPGTEVPEELRGGPYGTSPREGPLVAPGTYRVRLVVGEAVRTRTLSVRVDPRVAEDGVTPADLRAQEQLALRVRDAVDEAARTAMGLDSLRRRVARARDDGALAAADAHRLERRLDGLRDEIVTSREGSYPPPVLLDQLIYLYGMLTEADQRPGRDAYRRYGQLVDRLSDLRRQAAGVARSLGGAPPEG